MITLWMVWILERSINFAVAVKFMMCATEEQQKVVCAIASPDIGVGTTGAGSLQTFDSWKPAT